MDNLSSILLKEMEEKKITLEQLSIICDISCRQISNIINRKSFDIKISTLIKICTNMNISISDVFCVEKEFEETVVRKVITRFFVTDGKNKYKIVPFI